MAEKARERLGKAPNASVSVEDGQALSFADRSYDAVLCNLGLMFFPDPVRGLSLCRQGAVYAGPSNTETPCDVDGTDTLGFQRRDLAARARAMGLRPGICPPPPPSPWRSLGSARRTPSPVHGHINQGSRVAALPPRSRVWLNHGLSYVKRARRGPLRTFSSCSKHSEAG